MISDTGRRRQAQELRRYPPLQGAFVVKKLLIVHLMRAVFFGGHSISNEAGISNIRAV